MPAAQIAYNEAMIYDEFQKKSIALVQQGHSLIVSAPTGSGKTAIAEYVIEECIAENRGVVYTAPIKALSNQKYRDFSRKYGDRIGIVTGDVSLNPQAPVLIMTTEIFRNTILEDAGRMAAIEWVIFDEVHYLDDYERGTVWEESILFCPEHIRILALSATVPNAAQLAEWIQTTHRFPVAVVEEHHRPVPLQHLFQCNNRIYDHWKKLGAHVYKKLPRQQSAQRRELKVNRLPDLLHSLQTRDQLPALYFCFSRARCEDLAHKMRDQDLLTDRERNEIRLLADRLLARFNLTQEPSALRLRPLIGQGIAYHHAGLLPSIKEMVEQLFTSRLIKFIFTTETFALGINMPAKTVIFDELRKFYGFQFDTLRTRDYYQMAGRAGRRGIDKEGFVFSRINPRHIRLDEIHRVIHGKPEPVLSQCNLSYATLLHLYRRWKQRIYDIYPQTLHHFQSTRKSRGQALTQMRQKIQLLAELGYLTPEGITEKGTFAAQVYGYELALTELFAAGIIDQLNSLQLSIVLGALVFEPRKNQYHVRLKPEIMTLQNTVMPPIERVIKRERRMRIFPHSKIPYFNLAATIQLWSAGSAIAELNEHTGIDEGEIVRYFRMIIQLLRQLRHIPLLSPYTQSTLEQAITLLNRDEVDAEKQLREGI